MWFPYLLSSRAVPTGFWLGGCSPKFGPPSIPGPPESKNFSRKILATEGGAWGGGRLTICFPKKKFWKSFAKNIFPETFKIFSQQIRHFFKILQFHHVRAPSPQVGPPYFTFFGGCYPPPPPQVARPCYQAIAWPITRIRLVVTTMYNSNIIILLNILCTLINYICIV